MDTGTQGGLNAAIASSMTRRKQGRARAEQNSCRVMRRSQLLALVCRLPPSGRLRFGIMVDSVNLASALLRDFGMGMPTGVQQSV